MGARLSSKRRNPQSEMGTTEGAIATIQSDRTIVEFSNADTMSQQPLHAQQDRNLVRLYFGAVPTHYGHFPSCGYQQDGRTRYFDYNTLPTHYGHFPSRGYQQDGRTIYFDYNTLPTHYGHFSSHGYQQDGWTRYFDYNTLAAEMTASMMRTQQEMKDQKFWRTLGSNIYVGLILCMLSVECMRIWSSKNAGSTLDKLPIIGVAILLGLCLHLIFAKVAFREIPYKYLIIRQVMLVTGGLLIIIPGIIHIAM